MANFGNLYHLAIIPTAWPYVISPCLKFITHGGWPFGHSGNLTDDANLLLFVS